LIGFLIAATAALMALLFGLPRASIALIGCLSLLLTLWSNQALPLGLVALLPLILFPGLGILSLKEVAPHYANPVIYLFMGGFLLAMATEKSGLHRRLALALLSRFPSSPRGILYACALSAAIFSSFLSNTTTALLLIPLAALMSNDPRLQTRLVLAIAYGASIGGITTPIGTPPNLILLGFLETASLGEIGFLKWMLMTAPLAILMLLLMCETLLFGLPKTHTHSWQHSDEKLSSQDQRDQKIVKFLLLSVVCLLLLNPLLKMLLGWGIDEKALFLAAGLALFLPGIAVLDWKADFHRLPFDILFLFGAGFSIAKAFEHTGLASLLVQQLEFLQTLPLLVLLLGLTAGVVFLTEVTSNTALTALALPIILSFAEHSALSPLLLLMATAIAASYAFMLPIATPPNAIALSSGKVTPAQMAKRGLLLNLIGVALTSVTALWYWQWWLQ